MGKYLLQLQLDSLKKTLQYLVNRTKLIISVSEFSRNPNTFAKRLCTKSHAPEVGFRELINPSWFYIERGIEDLFRIELDRVTTKRLGRRSGSVIGKVWPKDWRGCGETISTYVSNFLMKNTQNTLKKCIFHEVINYAVKNAFFMHTLSWKHSKNTQNTPEKCIFHTLIEWKHLKHSKKQSFVGHEKYIFLHSKFRPMYFGAAENCALSICVTDGVFGITTFSIFQKP